MQNIKQYTTIKGFSEFIYKEKGSEFIAQAFAVETEEAFQKVLGEAKKKYYDASHHCYAVRLSGGFVKYSDDGEPGGTAGIRILNAIEHFQIHNAAIIVIRYFGGTKLGVGPLGKAYYAAAEKVMAQCEKVTKKAYFKITVNGDFSLVSHIHRIFASSKVKLLSTDYEDSIKFTCLVEPDLLEEMQNHLTDASKGTIEVKISGETLFI